MAKYLVIHLFAPIAAWGGVAKGEVRPTDAFPRRSGILGMLAAALGIRRHEEEKHAELARSTALAVEVARSGETLLDYQTIKFAIPPSSRSKTVYPTRADEIRRARLSGLTSERYYRMDADYRVALWVREDARWGLDALRSALERPQFVLYLGRKACAPATPLTPLEIEADSIRDAFDKTRADHYERLRAGRYGENWETHSRRHPLLEAPESVEIHWPVLPESSELYRAPGLETMRRVTKRDDPVSALRREFRQREERSALVDLGGSTPTEEQHVSE